MSSPVQPSSENPCGKYSRQPNGLLNFLRGLVVTVLIGSLQAYKLIVSPLLGSRCRFHPTCSCYAQQSVERFGPLRGSWLAICRLVKCGPWHAGGVDEVPPLDAENLDAGPLNLANRNRA